MTNLLMPVNNKCLRVVKIKKRTRKSHEYFDSDLLEKNPDNLTVRPSYHQTKRLYDEVKEKIT